jgi:hypothetical protein
MESMPLGHILFQPHEFSLLRTMTREGLWHEPRSLLEIADRAAKPHAARLPARKDLKRGIIAVLKKSIAAGLIAREAGFFFLTPRGRAEMASRFGLTDGQP